MVQSRENAGRNNRKTNSSLLQKMRCYWKNSLLLKKISLLLKKMLRCWKKYLRHWKTVFAIEIPLTPKKSSLIVNIVIKLRAYLYSEVYFCPYPRCQILWERCLFFNGICFPLDIQKHDSSKCSEHKTEVSVGRQSVLFSFSIQTFKSFESFIGKLQTKWWSFSFLYNHL